MQVNESEELARSRSSSITSTASLGDRVAAHDKEKYLYTYAWVNRDSGAEDKAPNAVWLRGNHFRTWVEDPYRRFPVPNSALNCWEAIIVLLYQYHAITKQDILTSYRKATFDQGDIPAIDELLGLNNEETCSKVSADRLKDMVQTGDVLIFHSRGSEHAHIALVLDNFEKLWIASHWSLPKEKMIRITPNRLFSTSKENALLEFSMKFRSILEQIQEKNNVVLSLLQKEDPFDISNIVSTLKESYTSNRDYNELLELYEYAKQKRISDYREYRQDTKIDIEVGQKMEILYQTVNTTLYKVIQVIEKFKANNEVLGVVYDCLDSLDQIQNFHYLLFELDYLTDETITVSTKFRRYFEE